MGPVLRCVVALAPRGRETGAGAACVAWEVRGRGGNDGGRARRGSAYAATVRSWGAGEGAGRGPVRDGEMRGGCPEGR